MREVCATSVVLGAELVGLEASVEQRRRSRQHVLGGCAPGCVSHLKSWLGVYPASATVSTVILWIRGVLGEARRSDAGEPYCDEVRRSRAGVSALLRRTATERGFTSCVPNTLAWRPRVNIQNDHGKAKPYQVRQVLAAIARLEEQE